MRHTFGKIESYLLFGGGQLLFELACEISKAHEVRVVTSRRHGLHPVQTEQGETSFVSGLEARGIPTWATQDVARDERTLGAITLGTLGISLGAEWIFPHSFIERFQGRLVNLHGSRLPLTRGGGGFSWLIMLDERRNGSRIHLLDGRIDTGAIVAACDYTFPEDCRIPIDYQAVARRENARLLRQFVADVEAGMTFELQQQDERISTYWPRLNTDLQGYIDWSWNASDIERFIRAFDDPYQGASTFWNARRVYLKEGTISTDDGVFHPFQRGLVYRKIGDTIFIAATTGSLVVRSVRDAEGVSCSRELRLGDRLHTPRQVLDSALEHRAVLRAEAL